MKESGFSLVEVMFSLVLIAVIGTGMMKFLITSSKKLSAVERKITAHNLARLKLEEYLTYDYSALTTSAVYNFSESDYKEYQYQILVQKINSNLKQITVIVKDAKQIWAKLSTMVAREI